MRSPAPQHNAALATIEIDDALSGAPPAYFARTASARQLRKHFLHIAIAIDGGQEGFDFFELLGGVGFDRSYWQQSMPPVGLRVQPCRNVTLSMQNAPDINVIFTLDEEHQIWVAGQRPGA